MPIINIYVHYGTVPKDVNIISSKELEHYINGIRDNNNDNSGQYHSDYGITFHTLDTWFFQSEFAEIANVYLVYDKDKVISLNDMLNHKEQASVKSKRNWRAGHNFMKLLHTGEFE